MKSKLLIYILPVILVSFLIYGYSIQDDPRNDSAPVSTIQSDTIPPAGFPYPTVWNFNYTNLPGPAAGSVGAIYFQGKYILNRWNSATWYRLNPDGPNGGPGTIADSNNAYNGGTGAIRDMAIAPDGSGQLYLWGGSAGTALYKLDSLGNRKATYTHAGAAYRAIAWDNNRKGFWSSNFGDNIVCRDTNGVVIRTITASAITGKYGLAFDSTTSADTAFLWVWSQVTGGLLNQLDKISLTTGTVVRTYQFSTTALNIGIAGGAEIVEKDNKLLLLLNYQNQAVVAYKLKDLVTPPITGNTLVLVHDTVAVSTIQRKADRDTLNTYLRGLVGNYTMRGFDTTTALADLSTFNTIILQETSFDTGNLRYLGATARGQVKTWLASGTPTSKKSLIMIGADQAYNYSRATSGAQDISFAETYGKFIYRLDNASGTTSPSITGVATDIGNVRPMTSTPPGASYWPDGASVVAGGSSVLYKYQNHTSTDTVAGIGNVQTNFVVATLFQDPRYFTGGFRNVLAATVAWVVANGGVITGFNNHTTLITPDSYKLTQNYPNPFNPTTKISFSIPKSGLVTLKIYDLAGKEVGTLVNEFKNIGNYDVQFNGA
ncbi:MAG: hypothetical protein ABI792_00740, partial [bacterium]